ncbi:MAG: DegT/DnrJ/EryC1/StrS aminotransferase family protein [Armatimonadetes bacterium]|nr:DegT/DnrJ/EryC1/StrS aminotransferase family protein [Armatimonadota bacterium]
MISHSRPSLDDREVQAADSVIRSGQLASGSEVAAFERETAAFVGVPHAIAVSSGTAALHLALLALGAGSGDEVILPSYVCAALLYAVRQTGAEPRFADIRKEDFNLDPDDLPRKITKCTKALLLPHMFGMAADIREICDFGIPLIEDCAMAFGAHYEGKPLGGFGLLSVASFYATKMLTTGEGGMIFTRSGDLAEKVRNLREYDHKEDSVVHYNCKMTDMAAAIGRVQLKKLGGFIAARKRLAGLYEQALSHLPLCLPLPIPDREHIFYRYAVRTPKPVQDYLTDFERRGLDVVRPVFRPLHTRGSADLCPVAEDVFHHTLSLPIYPALSEEEARSVAQVGSEVLGQ